MYSSGGDLLLLIGLAEEKAKNGVFAARIVEIVIAVAVSSGPAAKLLTRTAIIIRRENRGVSIGQRARRGAGFIIKGEGRSQEDSPHVPPSSEIKATAAVRILVVISYADYGRTTI